MNQPRRELPATSAFAGDDGSADPTLARVLADLADGRATRADVVASLTGTRVLAPVLPHAQPGVDGTERGPVGCHDATTGVVGVALPDGRTAMPIFTCVSALAAWRSDARPWPAQVARAAASALTEGWPVLVLDPAGPVTVQLPRPAVQALATGTPWRPPVVAGVVDRDVQEAVARALEPVRSVTHAHAEPGTKAELAVLLHLAPGLDRAALDRLLAGVNAALAAQSVLTDRVDSIELRLRPA